MRIGIAGLKSSGKSTLFDVLIGRISAALDKPGETRNGVMQMGDERVDFIAECYKSKKKVYPSFEVSDLPPLKTSKDPGDKSYVKILEDYKKCDGIIQVVRQFSNPAVPSALGEIEPAKEKSAFDTELILSDLTIIENRLERIIKMKNKVKDFTRPGEQELLEKCRDVLEDEKPVSSIEVVSDEEKLLKGFQFLTNKSLITVINIDESELGNEDAVISSLEIAHPVQKSSVEAVCAQTEKEILELSEEERSDFRKELGITNPAPLRVTDLLIGSMKLIRFLTGGEKEARSWIIPANVTAPQAGSTIHTDIEKGFIRLEVLKYSDMLVYKSEAKCKEAGKYRLEGKEYIMQDGDVVYFRFNV